MVGWKSLEETVQYPCPFPSPTDHTQTEDWRSSPWTKDTKPHWRKQRTKSTLTPWILKPPTPPLLIFRVWRPGPLPPGRRLRKFSLGIRAVHQESPKATNIEFAHGYVQLRGFLSGSAVKNPPARPETRVWSLGQEDPLEEVMATYSSILAGRIPWTEEPGGLQFIGLQRVRHDWSDWARMHDQSNHSQGVSQSTSSAHAFRASDTFLSPPLLNMFR